MKPNSLASSFLTDRDAVRVVMALSNDAPRFREVVASTGLDRSPCLRLLRRMTTAGVVVRRPDRGYALTRRGLPLWEAVRRTLLIAEAAYPGPLEVAPTAGDPTPAESPPAVVVEKSAELPDVNFRRTIDVGRTVAREPQLRILVVLSAGPMNVAQIAAATRTRRDNLSQHLNRMHLLGVVERRQEGARVFYSLTAKGSKLLSAVVECAA